MPALLELNEVSRIYNGEEETVVLNKISLTINATAKWWRLLALLVPVNQL